MYYEITEFWYLFSLFFIFIWSFGWGETVNHIVNKIKATIISWSQRNLTIKGRIVIVRTLLASQLIFISSCHRIANTYSKEIQSLIMRFIWRGRPPKVAKETLCQNAKEGGLNAVDVERFSVALRLNWVRRIVTEIDSPWRVLLQERVGEFDLTDVLRIKKCKVLLAKMKIPIFIRK